MNCGCSCLFKLHIFYFWTRFTCSRSSVLDGGLDGWCQLLVRWWRFFSLMLRCDHACRTSACSFRTPLSASPALWGPLISLTCAVMLFQFLASYALHRRLLVHGVCSASDRDYLKRPSHPWHHPSTSDRSTMDKADTMIPSCFSLTLKAPVNGLSYLHLIFVCNNNPLRGKRVVNDHVF